LAVEGRALIHPEIIQARLRGIIIETEGADGLPAPGGFGLTPADELRIKDNHKSGRHAFQKARMAAWEGLAALDREDTEAAQDHLGEALVYLVTALRSLVKPSQLAGLLKPAKNRSRPADPSDLPHRVSVAMVAQSGDVDLATLELAFRNDEALRAEFKKLSIQKESLLKRVRSFRKTQGNKSVP